MTHNDTTKTMTPLILLVALGILALLLSQACTPNPTDERSQRETSTPESHQNDEKTAQQDQTEPRSERMEIRKERARDAGREPTREAPSTERQSEPTLEVSSEIPEQSGEKQTDATPERTATECHGQRKTFTIGTDTVGVICSPVGTGPRRRYTLETTHTLRDNLPPNQRVTITEPTDRPYVRSGNVLFDSLYAMALQETAQNSVSQVKEGAFQQGKPYPCNCFQTGEKWTWAWTRDTAYAIDLGLAALDPARSLETLQFKLSKTKASSPKRSTQIVQDTGTGGSWPVSTDRVTWATGLLALLRYHPPAQTSQLLDALWQTIQHDRKWVFDPKDGLYRGEQSFLDWREQSYPSWSKERISTIAMSKALSTNVNHLIALDAAATLAKALGSQNNTIQQQATQWATQLRVAIAKEFQVPGTSLLSTMKTHALAPAPVRRFDLLGNALAIIAGVVDKTTAAKIVASYPHSQAGPPVQWPQQPLTPIYHNRAIWPFVTAYWLRAAVLVNNATAIQHNLHSLLKGAALNLSHMENFEFTTLANYYQDGAYSGPVINSRRQLWSVAGYISAIHDVIFGLSIQGTADKTTMRWQPKIPRSFRQRWFTGTRITLHDFTYQGKTIDIALSLPPTSTNGDGLYEVGAIQLNGVTLSADDIPLASLKAKNTLEIALQQPSSVTADNITIVQENGDFRTIFSPKEAAITKVETSGQTLALTIDSRGETGTEHIIYRDGKEVATGIKAGRWVDPGPLSLATDSPCYSVVAYFPQTKNYAHQSIPVCWHGVDGKRRQILDAWQWQHKGGRWAYNATNEGMIDRWGASGDTLTRAHFQPHWSGEYTVQMRYRNPTGATSTGITAATKLIEWREEGTGQIAASAILTMPQSSRAPAALSSIAFVTLDATKRYTILIKDPQQLVNMSYFQHFADYNGGAGGGSQSVNSVEFIALSLAPRKGKETTRSTGKLAVFDGKNDLDKLPKNQWLTPGIPLETWERFGLTWDDDWLYIAVVSKGFESPLKGYMLYVESLQNPSVSPSPATGMTYLKLQPKLPFTPTHLIGLRQQTDNRDGFGPWNGIWRYQSGTWSLLRRWKPARDAYLSMDKHTMSVKVPRALLGSPSNIRLVGHLVNAQPGNEWKHVIPSGHTPWTNHTTGMLEIDIKGKASAASTWKTR